MLKEKWAAVGEHHGVLAWARGRRERRKAEALTVRELMTSPVITAGPDDTLGAAARLMHERGVKRLPVVDADGKVVGIVSRQDLVKIFLRPDDEIRNDVVRDVIHRSLWLDPRVVRVDVTDGVVTLEGRPENKSLVEILIGLVRGMDGVVGIVPRLSFEIDDTRVRPDVPLPWRVLPPSLRYPSPRQRRAR
ncbi:MAG: CBS domain-containing protein [Actinomycetota bacterium]